MHVTQANCSTIWHKICLPPKKTLYLTREHVIICLISYSLELVLPDMDWSVNNSPNQSESKTTEKGLTFTSPLIFCCKLLVTTCCQNNTIESHKSVISVIEIRGIATFDINVHFCCGLMWNSVTMHRMKQNRKV